MRNPNCKACPLYRDARNVCIDGETRGDGPPEFLIVGQNPGHNEDRENRPFIGESGEKLTEMLQKAGIKNYRVTNAVRCYTPKNRKPTTGEIKACRQYLIDELREHSEIPLIIPLGDVPLRSLTGAGGITAKRGHEIPLHRDFVVPDSQESPRLLPTFHPAYVNRTPGIEPTVVGDFRRARKVLAGTPEPEVHYRVITDKRVALEGAKSPICIDFETKLVQKSIGDIHFLGVSTGDAAIALRGRSVENFAFEARNGCFELVGHNAASFDAGIFEDVYGVRFKVHDTMLLAYLLDENRPKGGYKLESLCFDYLLVDPWKENNWDWDNLTEAEMPAVYSYNARDVVYTDKLFNLLAPEVKAQGSWPLYEHVMLPFARTLRRIEKNGLYIDETEVNKTEAELRECLDGVTTSLVTMGLENPRSVPQVRALLFGRYGFEPVRYTDSEQPSTDEFTLKTLGATVEKGTEQQVFIDTLLEHREITKLYTGHLDRFQHIIRDSPDRYGHPSYSQINTKTGRTASFQGDDDDLGFQAQNIPRDKRIRRCVGSPPGFKLISADLSQAEMRFVAFVSGSQAMKQVFIDKKDPHFMLAARVLNCKESEVTPKQRLDIKPGNFALLYCGDSNTLIEYAFKTFGIRFTRKEAKAIEDAFSELWQLDDWYQRVWDELKEGKEVRSIFGQVYHIRGMESWNPVERVEAFRKAVNYRIQGPSSHYASIATFLVDEELTDCKVSQFGHDSMLVYAPEAVAEERAARIKEIMEKDTHAYVKKHLGVDIDVPIEAETKILTNWT